MIELMGIKYISDKEASKRYGYSKSWFMNKRAQGQGAGPPYIQLGMKKTRVLYPLDRTDEWFKELIRMNE